MNLKLAMKRMIRSYAIDLHLKELGYCALGFILGADTFHPMGPHIFLLAFTAWVAAIRLIRWAMEPDALLAPIG